MMYFIVCTAALAVSLLTLFAGFGLGTLLMPVFALFFPLETAIAATAVVHFINNIAKLLIVGRFAPRAIVVKFLLGALPAAAVGALLLQSASGSGTLASYSLWNVTAEVSAVKLIIGLLLIMFAVVEFLPRFDRWSVDKKWLPLGGAISGFFGGLTGMQGALRTAFLLRCDLSKHQLIATASVVSASIDFTRLAIYAVALSTLAPNLSHPRRADLDWWLIAAASIAACIGSIVGARLITKITIRAVKVMAACLLCLCGLGLASGLLGR